MKQKKTRKLFLRPAGEISKFVTDNPWIWDQSTYRQVRIAPFVQTKSALILYREANALSYVPCLHKKMDKLLELIVPCLREAQTHFGRGYWCKAMLTMLPVKSEVKPHVDKGWPHNYTHRIHWVIATNPLVKFNISNSQFHFEQDEVWETDNRTEHSVVNLGNKDRAHLIADFVPEPGDEPHYWRPYTSGSMEDLFFQTVDRAREQWGNANNPFY
jgi:hypothetical protein